MEHGDDRLQLHDLAQYRDQGKRFRDVLMNGGFTKLSPLAVQVLFRNPLQSPPPFPFACSGPLVLPSCRTGAMPPFTDSSPIFDAWLHAG